MTEMTGMETIFHSLFLVILFIYVIKMPDLGWQLRKHALTLEFQAFFNKLIDNYSARATHSIRFSLAFITYALLCLTMKWSAEIDLVCFLLFWVFFWIHFYSRYKLSQYGALPESALELFEKIKKAERKEE
jgi:hypothetical protein